ncbi:hypothetical protein NYE80_09945 [Paenibacillus sp. FSL H7-0357]|uniref:hypothetical protein n=1 Tax=Paenibacillus sp. FSL H7-0357 TaxID=1536774 RepID=UPI001E3BD0A2|nr:hypothetical protein [Paenibacillus sp. FSL H7-0357]
MNARHQRHRFQRVTAALEKRIADADFVYPQHLCEQLRQLRLQRIPRRFIAFAVRLPVRRRQRLPVHLAVRVQRQLLQLHKVSRNHVFRQLYRQVRTQLRYRNGFVAYKIRAQVCLPLLVLAGHDHRFADLRMRHEMRLDLPALDPVAADLHLVVDPAQVLQVAVRQPSRQIAGPVHPRPRLERVVYEFLRRQFRPVQIAPRQSVARDAQLPRDAHRLQLLPFSENIGPQRRERLADVADAACDLRLSKLLVRHVHGRFRDPVHIDQFRMGILPLPCPQLDRRQRFSAKDHGSHAQLRVRLFHFPL